MPEDTERFKTLLQTLQPPDNTLDILFPLILYYLDTGEYGLREAIAEAQVTRAQLSFYNLE